jgi:hypothetical protein
MTEKILDPEYVDLEKTRVRFKIVQESGLESIAELTVPKGKQRGVNKYWDRIMDEFDIEEMRNRRNNLETEIRKRNQHAEQKSKTLEQTTALRILFNAKTKAFDLPFIANADVDTKSAIRRAPNLEILNFIINEVTKKYMEENSMDFNDYLDYLDDLEEELETKKES